MRVVAVDWSGRSAGAARYIWTAEVVDGALVALSDGRDRPATIDHLIALAARTGGALVAGLDFSFSFPAWYCAACGWTTAEEVWAAMATQGEATLAACEAPFWGRPGRPRPESSPTEPPWRRGEAALRGRGIKSTFQIGGSGAVGTGSIRGMPCLTRLRAAGFVVWPFHPSTRGAPVALEVYPRALTGSVVKSRASARRTYLDERFGAACLPAALRERAAASEDAFDAAVSALVMAAHADELTALRPAADAVQRLEGAIWVPSGGTG